MTDKELELINKLSDVIAGSTGHVLDAYTYYFVASSAVWAILGAVAIWAAYAMRKRTLAAWKDLDEPPRVLGAYVVPAILLLIGALMVATNISDMLTPRAMAIHQLMKDIRGG